MAQAAPAPPHTHSFAKKTFHKPTYCHHCSDLLWGLIGQGYGCEGTRRACAPCASISGPRARHRARHDQRVMQPGLRGPRVCPSVRAPAPIDPPARRHFTVTPPFCAPTFTLALDISRTLSPRRLTSGTHERLGNQ